LSYFLFSFLSFAFFFILVLSPVANVRPGILEIIRNPVPARFKGKAQQISDGLQDSARHLFHKLFLFK
jgi:hypothetical protein